MATDHDVVKVLQQTAHSLKNQARILRQQSNDLMKEARRVRAATKTARQKRRNRQAGEGRNSK